MVFLTPRTVVADSKCTISFSFLLFSPPFLLPFFLLTTLRKRLSFQSNTQTLAHLGFCSFFRSHLQLLS